jgi:hypothetical protein
MYTINDHATVLDRTLTLYDIIIIFFLVLLFLLL